MGILSGLLSVILIRVFLFLTLFIRYSTLLSELVHVLRHRNVQFRLNLFVTKQVINVLFGDLILDIGLIVVLDANVLSVDPL